MGSNPSKEEQQKQQRQLEVYKKKSDDYEENQRVRESNELIAEKYAAVRREEARLQAKNERARITSHENTEQERNRNYTVRFCKY